MRSFRWLLAVPLSLGIAAAASAQDKAKDKAPTHTSPYYPLKVGTVWTYRAGEALFSYRVARIEEIDKVPCARIETVVNNRVIGTEHVAVTKDGAHRFKAGGKVIKPPIRFLPLKLEDGAEWSAGEKVGDEKVEGKFTLSHVKEPAKVKIGEKEYQAIVVKGKDLKVNGVKVGLTYYFAENIGLVKQELEVAGNKVTFELEKFDLPTGKDKAKE